MESALLNDALLAFLVEKERDPFFFLPLLFFFAFRSSSSRKSLAFRPL